MAARKPGDKITIYKLGIFRVSKLIVPLQMILPIDEDLHDPHTLPHFKIIGPPIIRGDVTMGKSTTAHTHAHTPSGFVTPSLEPTRLGNTRHNQVSKRYVSKQQVSKQCPEYCHTAVKVNKYFNSPHTKNPVNSTTRTNWFQSLITAQPALTGFIEVVTLPE